MTSKTFKSVGNPCASISITPSADGVRTVHVHGIEATGVTVSTADAPALALAILEAAGHGGSSESSRLMQAFDLIELHVKEQERITAEAREQAELEAEALELFSASRLSNETVPSFDGYPNLKLSWLAVARKAREMAKEAPSA